MYKLKRILKEIKKYPHASVVDGKIVNCPYGSLAYQHEEGHLKYSEAHPYTVHLQWLPILAIFSITIKYNLVAQFLLLLFIAPQIHEESWAWKYAFRYYVGDTKQWNKK